MSQFKRFNSSENNNYNSNDAYDQGTLTWDPSNGLRIHDGYTGGGNQIGSSFSGNYNDLTDRPNGLNAVLTLIGGSSSEDDGKFLQQQYTPQAGRYTAWTRSVVVVDAPAHNTSTGVVGQIAFDANYIYRCTQTNVAEVSDTYTTTTGDPAHDSRWSNQQFGANTLWLAPNSGKITLQVGWTLSDGTNTRTITDVNTTGGRPWGDIITFDGASIDWSALTTITVIQVAGVEGIWKRTPLNADTW